MASSTVTLRALGLNTSPNQLGVEDGSLSVAKNVIIKRDNVVESRRGFKLFGNSFGTSSDRAKQLFTYKDRILRHYGSKLEFDSSDNQGVFKQFAGDYLETEAGLRIKGLEFNGNFYFTTSQGIKKISVASANDFSTSSGQVTDAGGLKAIDVASYLNYNYGDQSSFLSQDSAVAYRILWNIVDANNNLVPGTPSQRTEVYNSLLNLLLQDFNRVLIALDIINQGASLITDGNYLSTLKVNETTSSVDLRDNLLALATKLDQDILYADNDGLPTGAPLEINTASITSGVCTITFASGDATLYLTSGSAIYLNDFVPTSGTLNGAQVLATVSSGQITFNTSASGTVTLSGASTITSNEYRAITQPGIPSNPATNSDLEELQVYLEDIINRLIAEPNGVIPDALSNEYIDTLDVTKASTVTLKIGVPEGATTNHFYQVYRSSVAEADGAAVLSIDVFPSDEMQLVYEAYATQTEIDAGVITFTDITPDAFRGANLYTNPQTGEGILQANDIPPFAKDIISFKNVTFYLNTKTRQRKFMSLIGVQNMINDYNNSIIPKLTIGSSDGFNTYEFIVGEKQETDVDCVAGSALAASGTASYWFINSANNINKYYVWYEIGTATDPAISGRTGIKVVADAGDTATEIAEKTRDTLNLYINDFSATSALDVVTVENLDSGYADSATAETSGFTITITNSGTGEKATQEVSKFTCVADVAGSLAGTYITLNSAYNLYQPYYWFRVSGSGVDPAVPNRVGVVVDISTNDSASAVATALAAKVNTSTEFEAEALSADVTITNIKYGPANNSSAGTSGFTLVIVEQGELKVELSTVVSPAQAVEQTTNSLIRVINRNKTENVYGYYLSGAQEVPGRFSIEARSLDNTQLYIVANNDNTGLSFNPSINPELTISSISTGSPTTMLVTTSSNHGLLDKDYVIITNSNSTPLIDGYHQITYVSPTTFRLNLTITGSGTTGSLTKAENAQSTSNEELPNRVYYSKFQQPEAVPIINYIDVGAKDKKILRGFTLRDSAFVFKEDGLYRISGETIPFNLALFDVSCIMVAPDSASVANNVIYCSTRQGISRVSESGVENVSRSIDVDILKLSSDNYTNFRTATWGIGYESDNSYLFFTVTDPTDEVANQCFRYSNLTNTWTTYDITNTCGVIHPVIDKLYLGAGDTNFIEEERKTFSRYDYADREKTVSLNAGNYLNNTITLTNIDDIKVNDVLIQEQTVASYGFNMLLKKLDLDPLVNDDNYFDTLEMVGGDNPKTKLLALATKLDNDLSVVATDFNSTISTKSGSITAIATGTTSIITSANHGLFSGRVVTISGTNSDEPISGKFEVTVLDVNRFSVSGVNVIISGTSGSWVTADLDKQDLKACYNKVIEKLNADNGVSFSNYQPISNETVQESTIVSINKITKTLTLDKTLDYLIGDLIIFSGIECEIQYAPNTMQDPLGFKQVYEATIMFINKAFTKANMGFATDLLPSFANIEFDGDGRGIFGHSTFGSGFFGGNSNSAPFRTYVPREKQRCRYIIVRYTHSVAREQWGIYGVTLTGNIGLSTRAYR